jgi:hypothetical protein
MDFSGFRLLIRGGMLGVIGTKVLRVFHLAIHTHKYREGGVKV